MRNGAKLEKTAGVGVREKLSSQLTMEKIQKYALVAAVILVLIGMGLANPNFLTLNNIINIARQISITVIIAVGMTFCMISGGFDLSVGSVGIMSGCLAAIIMVPTGSAFLGAFLGLLAGTFVGFINGLCITKLKVNAFVTTLGTMVAARGVALLVTGGLVITGLPEKFNFIGIGFIMGIPIPIIIAGLITVVGHFFLAYTEFGLNIYAIGGNYHAANLAGLRNERVITLVFTIQGFLAALGGLVLTARVVSAQPSLMMTTNLDVIAAVVVGGTSLLGGRGTIGGTILGCILIGALFNGLNVIGVGFDWQQIVIGAVIMMAVAMDSLMRKR